MAPGPPNDSRAVVVPRMPIELSQFLKFAALAVSGGEAKVAIGEGRVQVNGEVESRKTRKLALGDRVTLDDQTLVVAAMPRHVRAGDSAID